MLKYYYVHAISKLYNNFGRQCRIISYRARCSFLIAIFLYVFAVRFQHINNILQLLKYDISGTTKKKNSIGYLSNTQFHVFEVIVESESSE